MWRPMWYTESTVSTPSVNIMGALTLVLPILLLFCAATAAADAKWPVEVQLGDASRPTGIVAARETYLFVATANAQIWRVDIMTGSSAMIFAGGDGQRFAGICVDERGAGTIYATGRDTGVLYAFNYDGVLQRVYQITPPSTKEEPHYLADCIHTRYRLLITDAYQQTYYWLPLWDKGPSAGTPASKNASVALQGYAVGMNGDWPSTSDGRFGAQGIEWSGKWNETAFVMHSESGKLMAFDIKSRAQSGASMKEVEVLGRVKTFPGAIGILFDSTNELVMYVSIPRLNAIAVLELDYRNPLRAKFQRYLTASLMDGPIMVGEYGDWIYPISGRFHLSKSDREDAKYVLAKMSRHRQHMPGMDKSEDPFSIMYDDMDLIIDDSPIDAADIEMMMTMAPPNSGMRPKIPAEDEEKKVKSVKPIEPTPTPYGFEGLRKIGDFENKKPRQTPAAQCFPAAAAVQMEDGSQRQMDELKMDDRVLVGYNNAGVPKYSRVFLFTHSDADVSATFVQITLGDTRALRLSAGHYAYVGNFDAVKHVAAGDIKVGDVVDGALVINKQYVSDAGLYHPHTIDGSIVVNGIRVSTYTTAVPPVAAHGLLTAFRTLHICRQHWILRSLSSSMATGGPRLLQRLWRI